MNRRGFLAAGTVTFGCVAVNSFSASQLLAAGEPSLKGVGAACGMRIGFAATRAKIQYVLHFASFVKANCNIMTPESELKWAAIRPTQDVFRFTDADWLLDFGEHNGIALRGHNLCWNTGNPPWLEQVLNKSNAQSILVDHIAKVAGRYTGKIDSWDVVNEPIAIWFNKPGGLYPGPWLDSLGPQYIDVAFHAAAAADPHALLVLNVHHVEHSSDEKTRQACLNLLESLLKRNVPVHALGIESHLDCTLSVEQEPLDKFIRTVRSMGLEVLITELDVNDSKVEGDIQRRDQVTAEYYRRYLDVVLPIADVRRLVFWSLTDAPNWMDYMCGTPQWQRSDHACNHRPGIIDAAMQIKPGYIEVIAALENNCKAWGNK